MDKMDSKELEVKELNEQGRTLFSCDKYEAAIAQYQQALAVDDRHIPTYFNICEAYIMADKFEAARKAMKRVLMLDKTNGEAHFHLGNIALLEENYEEGRLQYAKAVNCGYDNAQMYINMASVAEDRNEWEEAISFYNKAIVRDRTCYMAKIRKIRIYLMVNRPSEALNAAEDLIDTNPEIFEGHHFKFSILATSGRLAEARQALDKAQDLFPDDQGFMLDRAKLLELEGDHRKALEVLEGIQGNLIPPEVILTEKAMLLLAMDRIGEAQTMLEQYPDEPVVPEMKKVLMMIYLQQGNYAGMVTCADQIIGQKQYDVNYFAALYYRAFALKKDGRVTAAREAYEKAARDMQQACAINSALLDLNIYRALCYRELQNTKKAHEMLEYVQLVDPNLAEVYFVRYLLYKDADDHRASEMLLKAQSIKPEIAELMGE